MIEELRIQNFQAHSKFRVVFAPGITTIVGPSDVGKSAIIRALRWAATNQPGGDAFVRYGTKGTTVKLVVGGRTVARKRKAGGEVNTYHLDDTEFKAFGRGVPDTIAEFLNMPEVCWQGQHDPSFWFGETPGEVSRQLNAIVDLGVIDIALTNVGRALGKARTRLEVAEEELTKAKGEVDDTAWAIECDEYLTKVEQAYGDAYAAAGRAEKCRGVVRAVGKYREVLETARGRAKALHALKQRAEAAITARDVADRLRHAITTAVDAGKKTDMPVPDFTPVHRATKMYVTANKRRNELESLLDEIDEREETVCHRENQLKIALEAMPRTCPTCGQSLPRTST